MLNNVLLNFYCVFRFCVENWGDIDDKVREGVFLGLLVERGSFIN